jgi:DNA-3-methyladenine glycosylase II
VSSADGGPVAAKRVRVVRHARGFDLEEAAAHLARRDRKLGRWIAKIGPVDTSGWNKPFDTVDALARAILYQQLSGKAAATIVGRVEQAIGSVRLTPDALARVDDAALRACGVSGNKTLALRDLARRAGDGEVPDTAGLLRLHHDEIIERLTAVRGIGRWTVEMLLMFRLGRPDILPVDDLGVRKGAQLLDRLEVMPTPKELAARGEAWGPYRTLAGLYLWRIADNAPPTPRAAPAKKATSKKAVSKTAASKTAASKRTVSKKAVSKQSAKPAAKPVRRSQG